MEQESRCKPASRFGMTKSSALSQQCSWSSSLDEFCHQAGFHHGCRTAASNNWDNPLSCSHPAEVIRKKSPFLTMSWNSLNYGWDILSSVPIKCGTMADIIYPNYRKLSFLDHFLARGKRLPWLPCASEDHTQELKMWAVLPKSHGLEAGGGWIESLGILLENPKRMMRSIRVPKGQIWHMLK